MKLPVIAVYCLSALSASCVAVKRNAVPVIVEEISEPEVGATVTVGVGEQMVRQGTLYAEDVLTILEQVDGGFYTIPAGEYPKVGSDETYEFYDKGGIRSNGLADPPSAIAVPRGQGQALKVVTVFGGTADYEAVFRVGTRYSPRHDSFQQTLIYSGRVGNRVNIGYREFSNNVARPAFNNDVEYDLDDSDTIGYKGARLQIISASNSQIVFKLLSNFN